MVFSTFPGARAGRSRSLASGVVRKTKRAGDEVALVGPDCPNAVPPVYKCDYTDQLDSVGKDGCVPVPQGPGLGVQYDWEFIAKNRVALHEFK